MKKLVKTLIVCAAMLVGVTSVSAQDKGEMAAGVNFAAGFGDNLENYGLAAKFQYNIIDNLRVEPSFTYFFKKNDNTLYDFDVNFHYLFNIYEGINIYPLAGVGIFDGKTKFGDMDAKFIGNVGAGVDFAVTEVIDFGVDYKFKFGTHSFTRNVVSIGATYRF